MEDLFAVCQPGLETALHRELVLLGLLPESPGPQTSGEKGGLAFKGSLQDLYRANLHLRTASRVLLRFAGLEACSFAEFRKKASHLPWEKYIRPGQDLVIRVTCHRSKLYHSDAVAERLAGAVSDRLGQAVRQVKADEESGVFPQMILARFVDDHCTISLDTSGTVLHKRGYRLETAKAPLRETLAAGLLITAGWDGSSPLIDPFCGSGAIPIEAVLIARRMAPGKQRRFAFMDWPGFDLVGWQKIMSQAEMEERPLAVEVFASDRDAGAVRMAQANAARAGVEEDIHFSCMALSAIQPPATPGWVITNPPYGRRISAHKDLRNLYAQLGNVMRVLCPGWQIGFLCNDDMLAGQTRLAIESKTNLTNGGLPVRFYISNGIK